MLVGLVLGIIGFKGPFSAAVGGIVENCIQSILTLECKLAQRISSLVSAFSSIGGFIAFFLDLSDFSWDDYWTPTYHTKYIIGFKTSIRL